MTKQSDLEKLQKSYNLSFIAGVLYVAVVSLLFSGFGWAVHNRIYGEENNLQVVFTYAPAIISAIIASLLFFPKQRKNYAETFSKLIEEE